jgi:uncharacterized protein (UPF0333 family)
VENSDFQQAPMDDLEYHGQSHHPHYSAQKKSHKKLFIILGVSLGVLIIGGGAAAYFLMHKSSGAKTPAKATASTSQSQAKTPAGVTDNGSSYTYKSSTLKVGVTYPKTWTMRESTDKQEVILTSPETQYVKKGGSNTSGVFTLKLRNGIIPDAIKTAVQNATAVDDSFVIGYTKPTGDQREYTNLSYLGADANNFSFALVTGYTTYKAGQSVGGGVDLNGQAYLFGGGYGADAADTFAFDAVPKADYDTATFQEAVAILESLQIY